MAQENLLKAISILTGLIIAGEDLALLIGMHFLSCANLSLFLVNNLKIAGLLAIAALGVSKGLFRQT